MQTRAAVTRQPNRPFPVDTRDRAEPAADQFLSAFPPAGVFFDGGAAHVGGIGSVVAANRITTVRRRPARARAANDLSLTTGFHGARKPRTLESPSH